MFRRIISEVAPCENHLTELLDEPVQEAYSEATCREPDARLIAGGASLGRRNSEGVAGPQSQAFGPSPRVTKRPKEETPGSRSRGSSFWRGGTPGSPASPLLSRGGSLLGFRSRRSAP